MPNILRTLILMLVLAAGVSGCVVEDRDGYYRHGYWNDGYHHGYWRDDRYDNDHWR